MFHTMNTLWLSHGLSHDCSQDTTWLPPVMTTCSLVRQKTSVSISLVGSDIIILGLPTHLLRSILKFDCKVDDVTSRCSDLHLNGGLYIEQFWKVQLWLVSHRVFSNSAYTMYSIDIQSLMFRSLSEMLLLCILLICLVCCHRYWRVTTPATVIDDLYCLPSLLVH